MHSSNADDQVIPDEDLCVSCKTSKINIIFSECGHMVACKECARTMEKCPICDKNTSQTINLNDLDEEDRLDEIITLGSRNAPQAVNRPTQRKREQKPPGQIQNLSDIQSEDVIAKLPNRQLKNLIKDEVNCETFCEKEELVAEVKRQWKNARKNEHNEETTCEDGELCCICNESEIDCMYSHCGHMVSCFSCTQKDEAKCPICNSGNTDIVLLQDIYNELYLEEQPEEDEDYEVYAEGACLECKKSGITHIFPKCGHMTICKECSQRVTECPICEQINIPQS